MRATILSLTRRAVLAALLLAVAASLASAQVDPLPSWNSGGARVAIIDFVARVIREGGPDFVPGEDRIGVFDNDGTLRSEQPAYFQAAFAFDQIRALAKDHPEWNDKQPRKAMLEGDMKSLAASGEKGLLEIVAATLAGMNVSDFNALVADRIKAAHHPRLDRPYSDLVFRPLLELRASPRANGFSPFIVSGGGEFTRAWAPDIYGIPPEQIIGSSGKTEFRLDGDKPEIAKLPAVEFVADGPGKPVGINRFMGRRPVFADGNSDGDLQMLPWARLNSGLRFGLIVHHADAERAWAYDRNSSVGRLDKGLDEAPRRG